MSYSDEDRLDYVFHNIPMMDRRGHGGASSHWIKVWDNHKSDWIVYHGADYRECIDKALDAQKQNKRLQSPRSTPKL